MVDADGEVIPRVAIHHFLLWIAAVAFCLTGVHYSLAHAVHVDPRLVPTVSEDPWNAAIFWALVVASAVVRGAAIAGVAITIRWHFGCTRIMSWQPGHLLLLVLGAGSITAIAADLTIICASSVPLIPQLGAAANGLMLWFTPFFFAVVAWKWADVLWKSYFLFASLVALVPALMMLLHPANNPLAGYGLLTCFQGCLIIGLAAITITDWVRHRERDWLHWLGVMVAIALSGIVVLWGLWKMSY